MVTITDLEQLKTTEGWGIDPTTLQGDFGPFPGGFRSWDHFHCIPNPILHIPENFGQDLPGA